MKKPKPKVRKAILDYFECEKYIAKKLGIKDLQNVSGKTWGMGGKESDNRPYQDFWHYICDTCEPHNGGTISLYESHNAEDWQKKIVKAFHEEFGEDAEYLVEW